MTVPLITVIIPVYNAQEFIADSVRSVLEQSFHNFELLIVDDGSPDRSINIVEQFQDARICILTQANRGLAGARNTGIRNARGRYIAFLDADDCWHPNKLALHIAHLESNPEVGVSFSRSEFMDLQGKRQNRFLMPKLQDLTTKDILYSNPVGNGSAPVIRRETLEAIGFKSIITGETNYFDETFTQAEDCECWIRIALQTPWRFEGIPEALTYYRINDSGLSAGLNKQFASLERVITKVDSYRPDIVKRYGSTMRAYNAKYLARNAIRFKEPALAVAYMHQALQHDIKLMLKDFRRTFLTLMGAYLMLLLPRSLYTILEALILKWFGSLQKRSICDATS